MGRAEQARTILTKVAGAEFANAELTSIRAALSAEKGTCAELFSRTLRLPLIVGILLAILQQVTGINVFLYFGTTIFKNMSASTGVHAGMLQQIVIGGAAPSRSSPSPPWTSGRSRLCSSAPPAWASACWRWA
jgi:hypothetical protein